MKKTLFINGCVRENSRTLELASYVLNKIGSEIEEVKLYDLELKALDINGLQMRDVAKKNNDFSGEMFELARQFAMAETIVIAVPYWDLMFPAVVKTYFEDITVSGLTFNYGENGRPVGLCKAKKLIYVTTSGGPIIHNFGYDYVATLSKMFYGIKETMFISAQGLDIQGADVSSILNEAKNNLLI